MKATRPLLCIAGLLVVAALGAWHLVTNDTIVRQHIRMRAASDHLPTLAPLLAADPAFSRVVCTTFTGAGWSLIFHCQLADEATYKRLRTLVASAHPPVTVVYDLQSDGEPFYAVVQYQ